MNRTYRALSTALLATAALIFAVPSAADWGHHDDDDGEEIPFDEAEIFFELNNTDGDLGIHALIDGEGWKRLNIEDPYERQMLWIWVIGRLRKQGLTEIFFESAEPTFDELPPPVFFNRFPEGDYEIEGRTLEGDELESVAVLTHLMPAPPEPTVSPTVGGAPPFDDDCDEDPATVVTAPVTIAWPAVTMSHPDPDGGGAGVQPPETVEINNYEVVVEILDDEVDSTFSIQLPPDSLSITLPSEFTALGTEFKYEVLAREESFNQTAVESCFVLQ